MEALLPGFLLSALVTHVEKEGLVCKIFGLFDATIDRAHLASPKGAQRLSHVVDLSKYFTPGDKVGLIEMCVCFEALHHPEGNFSRTLMAFLYLSFPFNHAK